MTYTEKLSPERVLTHGRVLWTPSLQIEWTNAGFSLRFRGERITLHLEPEMEPQAQPPYLNAELDGVPVLTAPVEADTRELAVTGLPDGEHLLRVRRRSEYLETPVRFLSVTVEGAAPAMLPPPAPASRRMEFIGDSLTCGYGTDTSQTSGFFTSQEDGSGTAAALTAARFGADDRYVCMSGQGIVRNCSGEEGRPIPRLFGWRSPSRQDRMDYDGWQPHVVVVNAGSNDVPGQVEPALFRERAAAFLLCLSR